VLPAKAAEDLPNLVPDPPSYVDVAYSNSTLDPLGLITGPPVAPRVLRFTSAIWNRGSRPIEILGTPTTDPLTLDASQCTEWTGALCTTRRPAGQLYWHHAHRHWHFRDFELYELRRLLPNGTPDRSVDGLLGASGKASFCLEDSDSNDSSVPFYHTCSGFLQGISPGWADVYDASLPGQSLPIEGLADGRYALVFTVDPDRRLVESDKTDNVAWAVVELYNDGTAARIVASGQP
jgi:hypothetical protein